MRMREVVGVLGLGIAVVGCAPVVGREFVRAPAAALVLGRTTYQEIQSRMGEPQERGTVARTKVLSQVIYRFQVGPRERGQVFFFLDDVLVGHYFNSTFLEDSTDFEASRVNEIRKGRTTEADAIRLLGPPSGRFIYPFLRDAEARGLGWYYGPPYWSPATRILKRVVLSVDGNGVVTDVEVTASGPQ